MTGDRRFLFTAFCLCLLSLRASSLLSQTPVVIANCVLEDRTIAEVFGGTQLPKLIADDRGLLLGGVSDIYRDSCDPAGEFWVVTDRGPNGKMKVDGVKSYTFPLPAFTPLIVHVKIDQNCVRVLKALPIVGNSGKAISGLPNRREQGGVPYDIVGRNELPLDVNGLDVEGMIRMSDGSFWLADEYGPSIVHVDSTGKILKRFLPAQTDANLLNARIDPQHQVAYVLPSIYLKREPNRGFESLAISPDEKTLYAAFQSPLLTNEPSAHTNKHSRNTRILAFDIASQAPSAEYIYQLGERTADGRLPDPRGFEIGAIATISDSKLLVLEHNGGEIAKLYRIDLRSATNTISSLHHSPANGEAVESIDLPSRNIEPLEKRLIADLGKLPDMPGKLEGLTILDAQTIAVANDNDFGFDNFTVEGMATRNGLKSRVLIVKLPKPLDEQ
jgi:hypothetical protein